MQPDFRRIGWVVAEEERVKSQRVGQDQRPSPPRRVAVLGRQTLEAPNRRDGGIRAPTGDLRLESLGPPVACDHGLLTEFIAPSEERLRRNLCPQSPESTNRTDHGARPRHGWSAGRHRDSVRGVLRLFLLGHGHEMLPNTLEGALGRRLPEAVAIVAAEYDLAGSLDELVVAFDAARLEALRGNVVAMQGAVALLDWASAKACPVHWRRQASGDTPRCH